MAFRALVRPEAETSSCSPLAVQLDVIGDEGLLCDAGAVAEPLDQLPGRGKVSHEDALDPPVQRPAAVPRPRQAWVAISPRTSERQSGRHEEHEGRGSSPRPLSAAMRFSRASANVLGAGLISTA